MKISRDEANLIAQVLKRQADKHRREICDTAPSVPTLEKAAKALKRGEGLEVER